MDDELELHNINDYVDDDMEENVIELQSNSSYLTSLWIGSGKLERICIYHNVIVHTKSYHL